MTEKKNFHVKKKLKYSPESPGQVPDCSSSFPAHMIEGTSNEYGRVKEIAAECSPSSLCRLMQTFFEWTFAGNFLGGLLAI